MRFGLLPYLAAGIDLKGHGVLLAQKNNIMQLHQDIAIPANSDFTIYNIPFGVGQIDGVPHVCSRIGDFVVDLVACHAHGLLPVEGLDAGTLQSASLNRFIDQGKSVTNAVRLTLQSLLSSGASEVDKIKRCFHPVEEVPMLLPVHVGDYTDFYSSKEHATNLGKMFRDPANALLPNWLHIPVGYHGRASSIVVSGTPVRRPKGQMLPAGADTPVFGPSRLLDIELEMAFVVGKSNPLGSRIEVQDAASYLFGMALFNDWSARDIQKWEYIPLGPFLGKNFASTMSPWIVTMEALEPFRVQGPKQEPEVLDYLKIQGAHNYDIQLFADLITPSGAKKTITHTNFKYMYWNMSQQLAHHTVNGCNMQVGDLCASGTISGPEPGSYGSLLEITWRGEHPISMPDGTERKFLSDGDTITLRGYAERDGIRVGFGEASGKILPAV